MLTQNKCLIFIPNETIHTVETLPISSYNNGPKITKNILFTKYFTFRAKHCENHQTLPWEHHIDFQMFQIALSKKHLFGCQYVKLFLLNYVTITTVFTMTITIVTITTVTIITVTITTVSTVTITNVTITTDTITTVTVITVTLLLSRYYSHYYYCHYQRWIFLRDLRDYLIDNLDKFSQSSPGKTV